MNKFRRLIQMRGPTRRRIALFRVFGAIVAIASAIFAGLATPVWASNPTAIHRVIAVGDLHGDFDAWRAIVKAAGLVDADGGWIGGAAVLVQLGDAVDRGPESLRIVNDLMRLQHEASTAGARVVAMIGNHEAMNMTDDLRYVTAADYAAFADANSAQLRVAVYAANRAAIEAAARSHDPKLSNEAVKQAWLAATPLGQIEHQRAWHPEGRIGRWVMRNLAVLKVDDTVFVHGGLNAAYAAIPLAEINRRVAAALLARDTDPNSIINAEAGPLWNRALAVAEAPAVAAEVDAVLKAYDAKRLVIAHTPILSGIATLYDGKLIRIDTGISAFYGGKLSYLEILDGAALPHEVERPASPQ